MPPKRTKAAPQGSRSTSSKTNKKRRSGKHSDEELLQAFHEYAVEYPDDDEGQYEEDDEGFIKLADVRKCLTSLGLPKPPPDFFEPDQTHVSWSEFLPLAQTLREAPGQDETGGDTAMQDTDEVDSAFALFTQGRARNNPADRITIADLRRVAQELREEVDDKILRLMIEEANGDSGRESVTRGVAKEDFENMMKRAGVFG